MKQNKDKQIRELKTWKNLRKMKQNKDKQIRELKTWKNLRKMKQNKDKQIRELEKVITGLLIISLALFIGLIYTGVNLNNKIDKLEIQLQPHQENSTYDLYSCLDKYVEKYGRISLFNNYDSKGYYLMIEECKFNGYCKYVNVYLNENCEVISE